MLFRSIGDNVLKVLDTNEVQSYSEYFRGAQSYAAYTARAPHAIGRNYEIYTERGRYPTDGISALEVLHEQALQRARYANLAASHSGLASAAGFQTRLNSSPGLRS
mgnify:CR=1 FL=1